MKGLFVDFILHYGGKWIKILQLIYEEKYVAARRDIASDMIDYYKIEDEYTQNLGFVAMKQLLMKGPCKKLFLVEESEALLYHPEEHFIECEYSTDTESKTDFTDNSESNYKKYNFEELEAIKMQRNRKVNDKLDHYKELHLSMTFKDKKEAKRIVDLYALENKKPLRVK
ncbi:hypothetical protein P3S68_019212 [Capsicum galapagoense]